MSTRRPLPWLVPMIALAMLQPVAEPAAEAALPIRQRESQAPAIPAGTAQSVPAPPTTTPPAANLSDIYSRFSRGISADLVRRVVWVHVNQIKYCYQQALFKQPGLSGRLVVNFQISPLGQVLELAVRETTLQSPPLEACITETMRTWEFPPTPHYAGITEINYPFVLRTKVPEPAFGVQVSDAELERIGIFKDPEPPAVDIIF